MTTAKKNDPEPSVLFIEGEMNIYRAEELKQTLLASVEKAPVLEVNLAAVTELDTAGVQLLMQARESAQTRKSELRLVAHSPAVVEVFELINLWPYFGDPRVASHHSRAMGRGSNPSAGEAYK